MIIVEYSLNFIAATRARTFYNEALNVCSCVTPSDCTKDLPSTNNEK